MVWFEKQCEMIVFLVFSFYAFGMVSWLYHGNTLLRAAMHELFPDISRWIDQKKPVCLATVINTWGSSPRQVGAKMAFTSDNRISGSVSGGCVEGAVIEAGIRVLQTGHPELLHYGVADETAFSIGLACGGNIEIFVRKLDEGLFQALTPLVQSRHPAALVTVINSNSKSFGNEILLSDDHIVFGSLGRELDDAIVMQIPSLLATQSSQSITVETAGQTSVRVFVDVINPPPVMVMVGGVHIAVILAALAKTMGFYTVIVDPRKAFNNPERFPQVDRLIQEWPEEAFQKVPLTSNTSVAILTHDPKIDDPALKVVLHSPAQYIGVLGSPTTHKKRLQRLQAGGFTPQQLSRLHAPIGINLGGKTPQETALGIMAEIIAAQHGKTIRPI